MRALLLLLILFCSAELNAQAYLPFYQGSYQQQNMLRNNGIPNETLAGKKWFVSRYSMVSAGYSFFRGGSFSYLSAPVGLQLNRRLNNNVYAFAGVSVAPTYINFNQPVPLSGMNKGMYGGSMYGPQSFGVYPRAELGLMYVNDEKTFSISGSINVQRGGYSVFPYRQVNTQQNNMATRPGQ